MLIRWFAGAAQAAGTTEETIDDPREGTIRDVLTGVHPDAAAVLQRCSFLVDKKSLPGDAPWPSGAQTLDVLPPFAGG